jgi:hypothetical protein
MCCEPKWGHHSPMGHDFSGGRCMPYGHHHHTPEEEKEMLESYKRGSRRRDFTNGSKNKEDF